MSERGTWAYQLMIDAGHSSQHRQVYQKSEALQPTDEFSSTTEILTPENISRDKSTEMKPRRSRGKLCVAKILDIRSLRHPQVASIKTPNRSPGT